MKDSELNASKHFPYLIHEHHNCYSRSQVSLLEHCHISKDLLAVLYYDFVLQINDEI
jgi:hypothetical protein